MDREDAVIMSKIYKVELLLKRAICFQDLVAEKVLPVAKSKKKLDEFYEKGYLKVNSIKGLNVYNVQPGAKKHILAYLDLKRELQKVM